jgi:general secretion pathway protein J
MLRLSSINPSSRLSSFNRTSNKGFTLLEVMIAISITALIGIASTNLLSNIIESKRVTDARSEQLITLQRFNQFISRDVEQIINRSIRDEYGDEQAAIIIDDSDYLAQWTRLGWRNRPIIEDSQEESQRAEIQRVAFQMFDINDEECEAAKSRLESWGRFDPEGSCLVRFFWPVLDRASDTEAKTQILLDLVEEIEIELLATVQPPEDDQTEVAPEQKWYHQWPNIQVGENKEIPTAMRWKITLPKIGQIERLWLLAYDDQ